MSSCLSFWCQKKEKKLLHRVLKFCLLKTWVNMSVKNPEFYVDFHYALGRKCKKKFLAKNATGIWKKITGP
jgi:hypothetical protein